MLHEIEGVEREIRSREDLVLEEMEKAEGLAADVRREEGAFKEIERDDEGRARRDRRPRGEALRRGLPPPRGAPGGVRRAAGGRADALRARGEEARHGGGRGEGRRVPDLPRAGCGCRCGSSCARATRSSSASRATASSTTSRRRRPSSSSRDAGPPPARRRREPRQPRRGGLRRARVRRPTAARWPSSTATSARPPTTWPSTRPCSTGCASPSRAGRARSRCSPTRSCSCARSTGRYRVKNPGLQPLFREAQSLLARFDRARVTPRPPRAEPRGRRASRTAPWTSRPRTCSRPAGRGYGRAKPTKLIIRPAPRPSRRYEW